MRLLDRAKGKQLEDALDKIEDSLKICYPYTLEDRESLYSNLEEIIQGVRHTLDADVGAQINYDKQKH